MAELLILFVVPALLALAAGWDMASFTIPNFLSLALIAAFAVFVMLTAMPLGEIGWHLAAGGLGLAGGFALFAFGFVGGGDAKLFAAATLWLGWPHLLDYALVTSLFGGGLALALIGLRHVPLPASLFSRAWVARLYDPRSGIPYGVALAAGALVLLPQTEFFHRVLL
jgi:prepilin peptidase CpaA